MPVEALGDATVLFAVAAGGFLFGCTLGCSHFFGGHRRYAGDGTDNFAAR